jgi:hypothetical protein
VGAGARGGEVLGAYMCVAEGTRAEATIPGQPSQMRPAIKPKEFNQPSAWPGSEPRGLDAARAGAMYGLRVWRGGP